MHDRWLATTEFLDHEHPAVRTFATTAAAGATDPTEIAVRLFHAVRDGWRYDPYDISHDPADYRASAIAGQNRGWCVSKSVLLAASARAMGIPARLGFADVKNHLTTEKLGERMGTDIFYWHGFAELLLDDRWFQLSTAFNIDLCERFGVKVLEFDGTDDALMHPFDQAGNRHMEYVAKRGSFDDLPFDTIMDDFAVLYPRLGPAGADTADDEFSA